MDALDLRIIQAMGVRPYQPPGAPPDGMRPAVVARRLGLAVDTVKARIARMEDSGFIRGYTIIPNFHHLRVEARAYYLETEEEDAKAEIAAIAHDAEEVFFMHDFMGPSMCVDVATADAHGRDALLGRLEDVADTMRPCQFYRYDMPAVERELTPLDWRILQALRGDARATPPTLAERVGVNQRTVRRRLERMEAERSFMAMPLLDPGRMDGFIPYIFLFFFHPGQAGVALRSIVGAFSAHQILHYVPSTSSEGNFHIGVFARNPAEVDEARRKALALPGVARVRTMFPRAVHEKPTTIDRLVAERLAEASSSSAAPAPA